VPTGAIFSTPIRGGMAMSDYVFSVTYTVPWGLSLARNFSLGPLDSCQSRAYS
jgi:hypothetical protein